MLTLLCAIALAAEPQAEKPAPVAIDTTLEVLEEGPPRAQLRQAGELLGEWTVELAGVPIDGPWLVELSETPEEEPLLRALREKSGRALKVDALVWLMDDLLVAGEAGRRGEEVVIPTGRARGIGLMVHPNEVFKGQKRSYPNRKRSVDIDRPEEPAHYEPAVDNAVPGPEWTARYPNPTDRTEQLTALYEARPDAALASRIGTLLLQLEHQGAEVYLTSTIRRRERGYLMWGAFLLSRAKTEAELNQHLATLADRNTAWGLNIPITWSHPDGWQATKEAARTMADTYDVVYATENGAKSSNHYDGIAVDFVALALPRYFTLFAPDGAVKTFDCSDPEHTRDISLSPEIIAWVEEHWGLSKLTSDYPHWNDRAR